MTNQSHEPIWRGEYMTDYGPRIFTTLNFALYEMVLRARVGLP